MGSARPPFDPELVEALRVRRSELPTLGAATLQELRRLAEEGPGLPPVDLTMSGRVRVEDATAPGPAGAPDLSLLVLRPATGQGPWPGIFHAHGGGMVMGTNRSQIEGLLTHVAEGAVLVSVNYRLAPEHPDPAPVEDCYAALSWTATNAAELQIDVGRLLIVGASAGGGLAAGTALLARDRGFPRVTHQVLHYPMLDDRMETPSSRMLDGEGLWDRNDNLFGWSALLGERRGGPAVSAYAAPARAEDLAGLPRTYLDVGDCDTFRDETIAFGLRLSQAGVSVEMHLWPGAYHGSEVVSPHAEVSAAIIAARDRYLRRALGRPAHRLTQRLSGHHTTAGDTTD